MDFLTSATIKAWLKVAGTDDDDILDIIGEAVEDRVATFLNRSLIEESYADELIDGSGTNKLVPKHFPVTAVTSIEVYDGLDNSGTEIWDLWAQNTDYDRLVIPTGGYCILLDGATFPKDYSNIKLNYTAGYDSDSLPQDIYKAMFDLCYLYYHAIRAEKNLGKLSDVQISGGGLNTTINYDRDAEIKILETIKAHRAVNV